MSWRFLIKVASMLLPSGIRGNTGESEPPRARTVRVFVRKFGVKYLVNANPSVGAQKFVEIIFDKDNISVKTV